MSSKLIYQVKDPTLLPVCYATHSRCYMAIFEDYHRNLHNWVSNYLNTNAGSESEIFREYYKILSCFFCLLNTYKKKNIYNFKKITLRHKHTIMQPQYLVYYKHNNNNNKKSQVYYHVW